MAVNWTTLFEGYPQGTEVISSGDDRIRDLKEALRERLIKEHEWDPSGAGTPSLHGMHKEGSAKAYVEATEPANRPDGSTALTNDDAGRIWFESDDEYLPRVYKDTTDTFVGFLREVTRGVVQGVLATGTNLVGPIVFPQAVQISKVIGRVITAPTGASLIVDIHKYNSSDVDQGTIFASAGDRLTIAAAGKTDDKTNAASEFSATESALVYGDYLQVDIDQIGSTVAGADLIITIEAVIL